MELTPFVAHWLPKVVLGLTCTKLAKVLCSLGHDVLEQLHFHPPKLLPYIEEESVSCSEYPWTCAVASGSSK